MIITQAKCDFFCASKTTHMHWHTHTLSCKSRIAYTMYYRPTIHLIEVHTLFSLSKIYMVSCAIRQTPSQFLALPDVVSLERFSIFASGSASGCRFYACIVITATAYPFSLRLDYRLAGVTKDINFIYIYVLFMYVSVSILKTYLSMDAISLLLRIHILSYFHV